MKKTIITIALLALLPMFAAAAHPQGTVHVSVNGLVCDFCARALEKVFGEQEAVETIDVNLDNKVITIHFNEGQSLNDETITGFINDAGYDVRTIHRGG